MSTDNAKTSRDYFAEMYVAGKLADAGWNVYFPRRDNGFDFMISKQRSGADPIIRPVQVKGKFPTKSKTDKNVYGYSGKALSQVHQDMVLAIPFFIYGDAEKPAFVAYIPRSLVRDTKRGHKCNPASFRDGRPIKRRDFAKFYDDDGIALIEAESWPEMIVGKS